MRIAAEHIQRWMQPESGMVIPLAILKQGERTVMVLVHSRLATVESRDNHTRGWGGIVESPAKFVEKE